MRHAGRYPAPMVGDRWAAALAGLDRAGADPGVEAVVVRDGAALLVRAGDVVVRVRRADVGLAVARREVDVAQALRAADVPVTELVGDDQPWAEGTFVVTAWRWTAAVGPAGPRDLGFLAQALRERTTEVAVRVPAFDPIDVILGVVGHLPTGDPDADFVRDRARQLAGPWADAAADDPLGHSIVHGDLHAENVVVGSAGPLLTDLELSGGGPPSYDAAAAAVAVGRFGRPAEDLDAFIDAYGADPRSWKGFATFVAVDELWGTAWAVGVSHLDPAWAAEASRRVASLRDGVEHRWRLS